MTPRGYRVVFPIRTPRARRRSGRLDTSGVHDTQTFVTVGVRITCSTKWASRLDERSGSGKKDTGMGATLLRGVGGTPLLAGQTLLTVRVRRTDRRRRETEGICSGVPEV